jgi:sporulation protein YlmC with PRC-barrel domain
MVVKVRSVNFICMSMRVRALAVALSWLVILVGSSYSLHTASAPNDPTHPADHFNRVRKPARSSLRTLDNARVLNLRGMIVENRDGQRLGKLEDFVLDMQSDRVNFALVSYSHGLGLRKHLKILPPQVLSTATAKKGVLQLDISYARWQHAPRFKMTDLPALSGPEPKTQIYTYYGQSTHTPQQARGQNLELANAIIGKQVANRHHELLGHFSDLLVDVTGQRAVLAIIHPDRNFAQSGSFAVPLSRVRPADEAWVLDISRKKFAEAPILDEESWQRESSAGAGAIYRFPDGASAADTRSKTDFPFARLALQMTRLRCPCLPPN